MGGADYYVIDAGRQDTGVTIQPGRQHSWWLGVVSTDHNRPGHGCQDTRQGYYTGS